MLFEMKLKVVLPLASIITLLNKAAFGKTLECVCINYDECNYDYSPKGRSSDYHELKSYEDGDQRPSCENAIDVCCDLKEGKSNTNNHYHNDSTTARSSSRKWSCGYRGGKKYGSSCGTNSEADRGEFPWMVAILRKDCYGYPKTYHCAGSLINEKFVLTSAKEVHKLKAGDLVVRAGAQNWKEARDGAHQDLKVHSIKVHPNFEPDSYINNCALLVLAEPAKESASVNSICLADSKEDYECSGCIETGWGKNRDEINRGDRLLRKSELCVIERNKCQNIYRRSYAGDYRIHESVICAGDEDYAAPCTGTAGSPMICPLKASKHRYVQAGISSIAVCHKSRKPGLYADVSHCLPWIDRFVKSRGYDCESYKA